MNLYGHYGNIAIYDYWDTLRTTIGIIDDHGNCVPMGVQAYDYYFLGWYQS